jgi:hypothetical protein
VNATIYRLAAVALVAIALVYAGSQIRSILAGGMQQDFRTYYYAARAYQQDLNPYDLQSLRSVSGDDSIRLRFVYPPHCLDLLKPLALLDYPVAYFLFFAGKLLALAGLILIWTRIVPVPRHELWALLVTTLMGYQHAVVRDLRLGNVSLFEQVLLWGGILLLFRGRTMAGGCSLLLSSVFKVLTAALAPLIVVVGRSRRAFLALPVLLLAGGVAYLASCTAHPDLWASFMSSAGGLDERGIICPGSLSLLRDLAEAVGVGDVAVYSAYALACCLVLGAWCWAIRQTRRSRDVYPMLYLTILAYVLVAPRMKDYSMIIALLPALHTMSAVGLTRRWAVVGCLLLWVQIFDYQALVLSLWVFLLLLRWIGASRSDPDRMMSLTLNPLRGFT